MIYRKIGYICPKEGFREKRIEIKIPKFFPIFSIQMPFEIEIFKTFLIKSKHRYQNGQLVPYKNHHYRSKYPLVLLQERCEIVQFKFEHPVRRNI